MSVASDSMSSSLLARIRQHDTAAWQQLVDLYGPLVFFWCRKAGMSGADAADVFQESFVSVSQNIGGFERRQGSPFRAWLWTIARNKIRDHFRRQSREATAAGGSAAQLQMLELPASPEDESVAPAGSSDRQQLSALFHRALELVRGEFEDRTWQAFWRVTVAGEETAHVAAELGISANGVRQAKSRVLRRLRKSSAICWNKAVGQFGRLSLRERPVFRGAKDDTHSN